MKHKSIFSAEESQILNQLNALRDYSWVDFKHDLTDIPLETILEVCSNAWMVPKETFFEKINHADEKDKLMKFSIFYFASFYSNKGPVDVSYFLQRGGRTYKLYHCWYVIKSGTRYSNICRDILTQLHQIQPDRLKHLLDVEKIKLKHSVSNLDRVTRERNLYYNQALEFAAMIADYQKKEADQCLKESERVLAQLGERSNDMCVNCRYKNTCPFADEIDASENLFLLCPKEKSLKGFKKVGKYLFMNETEVKTLKAEIEDRELWKINN